MATQKEIARRLNISQQAVSASLGRGNGSVKVSAETRERVLAMARETGYIPNQMARSLKSGRTGLIGVVMPFCRDPYFAALIDALNMVALQRSRSLLLQFHLWSEEGVVRALEQMIGARVEGILLYLRQSNHAETRRLIAQCRKRQITVVSLSGEGRWEWEGEADPSSGGVRKDYELEGLLLGAELLRHGHRSIDLLAFSRNHSTMRGRMAGVEQAIRNAGVKASARYVDLPGELYSQVSPAAPAPEALKDHRLLEQLADYYVTRGRQGTAVIASNEAVAWKIMAQADALGIAVPEELSVVCSGTQGEGTHGPMALTSAEYDAAEIASHAMDLLLAGGGRTINVAPRLQSRRSVATLKAEG